MSYNFMAAMGLRSEGSGLEEDEGVSYISKVCLGDTYVARKLLVLVSCLAIDANLSSKDA